MNKNKKESNEFRYDESLPKSYEIYINGEITKKESVAERMKERGYE